MTRRGMKKRSREEERREGKEGPWFDTFSGTSIVKREYRQTLKLILGFLDYVL